MAKKPTDVDDLDLESLGLDDLEMQIDPSKDDRKPVTKVAVGFVDGLKSTAKDPQYLRRTLLRALPDGYGKAARLLDEAGTVAGDLYNSTAQELGPAARNMAKAARGAMPSVRRYLPKGAADKLEAFLERQTEGGDTGTVGVNQQEANLALELGEIFKEQAKANQEDRLQNAAEQRVRQVIEDKKHLQSIDQLDAIRTAAESLVNYQDSITARYQRKSLELQYRHYFASRDLLELQRASNEGILNYLKDVVKNTGLPESVKINLSEASGQLLRDRMLTAAQGKVGEFAANYTNRFAANLKARFQQEVGAFGAGLGGLGGGMSLGDLDSMPGGRYGIAGNLGGSLFGEYLGRQLGDRARKYTERNEKIRYGGAQLGYLSDNIAGIANRWAKRPSQRTGILGALERFFQSVAPKQYLETSIQNDSTATADTAVHFNAQTRKSITEIIPGYLARILRSIDIMRTGDENTELTLYNLDRNQFTSASQVRKDVALKLFPIEQMEATRNDVDRVIGAIDKDGTLSAEARKKLQSQLLRDVASGEFFDPSRYADTSSYAANIDDATRAQLAGLFRDQFQIGADGKMAKTADMAARREAIARDFNWIQRSVPNSRLGAQLYTNLGYGDVLRDLGVVNKAGMEDRLNFDRVLEIYEGGVAPGGEVSNEANTEGGRQTRRNRRRGRGRAGLADGNNSVRNAAQDTSVPSESGVSSDRTVELLTAMGEHNARLLAALGESKELDVLRNDRLDEMLVRLDLMQTTDGFGPGTPAMRGRLNSIMARAKGATRTAYGRLRSLGARGMGMAANLAISPLTATMGALNFVKNKGKILLERGREKVQDVYVKGMNSRPALLARDLMNEEYRDALTGKVIKSVKDITGPVKDRYDNFVITAEDYAKGLYDSQGRSLVKRLKGAASNIWAFATAPTRMTFNMITGAGKWIKERYTKFRDVYVKGEVEPRLLALKLEAGEYVNAKTGQVITSMREIRDGVMDRHGNTILNARETAAGLVDKTGKLIRGIAMAPINALRGIASFGRKIVGGGMDAIAGALGMFTDYVGAGNKQVNLLEEIRDILNDRLPRGISGDGDGDGLRDGSWQAQRANRKERDRVKAVGTKEAGKGSNLFETVKKLIPDFDLGGGPDIDIDMDGRRRPRGRPRGRLGRIGRGIKDLGRGFMRSGLMRGALSLGGTALGALSSTALAGSVVNGAIAVGGGLASAGGALLSGAAAVASGIAGLISAPVLLTAGAIAAVGVGAYFAYKYFKKKGAYINKIRMAQYGVDPDDDDRVKMVSALEELAQGYLKSSKGSEASMEIDSKGVEKALEIFGVDKEDKAALSNWVTWLKHRFKPVFLSHATVLAQYAPEAKVFEADDKVPDMFKLEYVNKIKFPEGNGPYAIMASPFGAGTELLPNSSVLNGLLDEAKEKYAELAKKAEDKAKNPGVALRSGATIKGPATESALTPRGGIGAGALALSSASALEVTKGVRGNGISIVGATSVTGSALSGQIDPIVSVRLKAYGLTDLVYTHSRLIEKLEDAVIPLITFDKDSAVFNGKPEDLLLEHGAQFGIADVSGEAAKNWLIWFKNRFMPVLLNYCASVRKINKAASVQNAVGGLKPTDKLEIALSIAGTTAQMKDNKVSVWTVKESPFALDPEYKMNTNPDSVKVNIEVLQAAVKNMKLAEQSKRDQQTRASTTGVFPMGPGLRRVDTFQTQPSPMAVHRTNNYGVSSTPTLDRMRNGGSFSASDLTGGRVVVHPGGGTGGDINSLPVPKGDGWSGMKDMIVAASKMAGVDPGLMASKASIESSFKAGVSAGTSSATGLYQFIDSTWNEMLRKYGSKYGIAPGTPRTDPRANALMAAEYLKENQAYMEKSLGRKMTDVDLYAGHFLGAGGAVQLLGADPNADAVRLMPKAASANRPIFYEGGRPRTVGEVYQELTRRVRRGDKYADEARGMSGLPAATVASDAPATQTTDSATPATASAGGGATPTVPALLAPPSANQSAAAPSSMLASFAPGASPAAGTSAAGSLLMKTSADITTAPAPAPTQANTDAAVVQAQRVAEQQASQVEQQSRYAEQVQVGSLQSVESMIKQQVELQTSIDNTLKVMSGDLKTLVSQSASTPAGPLVAKTEAPAAAGVRKGTRPAETLSTQAPISMSRKNTA